MVNLGLIDIVKQMAIEPEWTSTTDFYQETLLIFEQDFAKLFGRMDFKLAANPDDYWLQFEAGWYQAMFGDKQQALKLFTDQFATVNEAERFGMPHCSPAIEVAWAELELGNKSSAKSLVEQCQNLLAQQLQSSITYFELHYLAARIYALNDQPTEAINALTKAIDIGWREYWTKYDPLLASLADEPEFQQLIKFLDDDLARQKSEALKLFAE